MYLVISCFFVPFFCVLFSPRLFKVARSLGSNQRWLTGWSCWWWVGKQLPLFSSCLVPHNCIYTYIHTNRYTSIYIPKPTHMSTMTYTHISNSLLPCQESIVSHILLDVFWFHLQCVGFFNSRRFVWCNATIETDVKSSQSSRTREHFW